MSGGGGKVNSKNFLTVRRHFTTKNHWRTIVHGVDLLAKSEEKKEILDNIDIE